ncbi:MAG TPA: CAP domain-containing protein [Candidatus Limnocylindrales bacterium]|nr:CAP domain-containing protein [Candidatus Limnocylindrales bacterium]
MRIFARAVFLALLASCIGCGTVRTAAVPAAGAESAAAGAAPSEEERELYELFLAYRADHRLPAVPLSRSLTTVARMHAADLQRNGFDAKCNIHSWSSHGPWTACCYRPDHSDPGCMWNKPRELTPYKGSGFEIGYWTSATARPRTIMKVWKSSATHSDVMLNRKRWRGEDWKAVGIGVHGGYAVLWLGLEEDPAGYWSRGR